MKTNLYPMTFKPVYQDYPWGGSRIPETYNRNVPVGIYAESWEISDRDDGMSIVANGDAAGKSLKEIIVSAPEQVLGTRVKGADFPLLIKLIDAKQKLSVQVHPNDETAAQFGGEAKTEMWYLLGENNTQVYCGLKDGVTRESFIEAVATGTSGDTMRAIPVSKDDAVFVRGGRVHAIDSGCLILEIQQNSNTTYRIYDWDRMGNDGKPRELHIEQALDVINWDDSDDPITKQETLVDTDTFRCVNVLKCDYFQLEKMEFNAPLEVSLDGSTFHALFVSDGAAEICWNEESLALVSGTSVLVPAAMQGYTLTGNATVLRTTVPE
ncbi:MAG: class I mannose-6-phosphate isomerase [Pontiellaceae bacterium]|nr:class I mannose-6-phosphate isomerase [Pontiellaceae bacterium]MBN2785531.1 class I mannose-6-phosphate isomerase [Pontiellaceae bacterium]